MTIMEEKVHCCLFCYRLQPVNQHERNCIMEKAALSQKQFFELLKRYVLHDSSDSKDWVNLVQRTISLPEGLEGITSPCMDCSGILKSFCEYYEEMKVLEMKLNWRLQTLKNIVESSGKVRFRQKLFQEKLEQTKTSDAKEVMKTMKGFRTKLVEMCTKKLGSTYPKVMLGKRSSSGEEESGGTPKRTRENTIINRNMEIKRSRSTPTPAGSVIAVNLPKSESKQTSLVSESGLISKGATETECIPNDKKLTDHNLIQIKFHTPGKSETEQVFSALVDCEDKGTGCASEAGEVEVDVAWENDHVFAMEMPRLHPPEMPKPIPPTPTVVESVPISSSTDVTVIQEKEDHDWIYASNSNHAALNRLNEDTNSKENNNFKENSSCDIAVAVAEPTLFLMDVEEGASELVGSSDNQPVNEFKIDTSAANNIAVSMNSSESLNFSLEDREIQEYDRVSLRQRHRCDKCSKNFSTRAKAREHISQCRNADEHSNSSDENAEEDDNDFQELEFNADDDCEEEEAEEEQELEEDICTKSCRPKEFKVELHEFMKTVFKCEVTECDSFFYNGKDLDNHSQLHGSFQCSKCPTILSYAPDLLFHELEHKSEAQSVPLEFSCPYENCYYKPRRNPRSFVSHFLKSHLKLVRNTHTCPVCQFPIFADKWVRGESRSAVDVGSVMVRQHFLINHNLNSETDSKSETFRCNMPSCSAYFLKESQLAHHSRLIHKVINFKEKSHACKKCDNQFWRKGDLLQHVKVVHEEDHNGRSSPIPLFLCEIEGCMARFRHEKKLKSHVARHHSQQVYVCSFCNKSFVIQDHLIYHQNQAHGKIQSKFEPTHSKNPASELEADEILECPVETCPEKFYNPGSLEAHALLHGNFECYYCEETRSYAPDLALHEESAHKMEYHKKERKRGKRIHETFCCPRCDFKSHLELRYVQHHLHAHLKLEMVVQSMCCICKVVFKTFKNWTFCTHFLKHYKIMHEVRSETSGSVYHCDAMSDNCQAYFLTEDQLYHHRIFIHGAEASTYPCPDCEEVFKDGAQLGKHRMKYHKSKMKIPCSYDGCGVRFDNEQNLKKHFASKHAKSRLQPELCPHCGKVFESPGGLRSHVQFSHSSKPKPPKTKKFICAKCGKGFFGKVQLKTHDLQVHVGPEGWQFSCDVCDKKCLTSLKLEEHKRTHTQEKPFACEHCGLRYAHRHNFRHHLKSKHGIHLERPKSKFAGRKKEVPKGLKAGTSLSRTDN